MVRDGRLVGDNTDALGLELALRHDRLWPLTACSVVVLGAGGAAAAAVLASSRANPATITVVARREHPLPARVRVAPWSTSAVLDALHTTPESMLVNATPAPLEALPFSVDALPASCTVVDLRYRPRPVDLVAAARARGLRACDGLEMLLQQGMLSFRRWTGVEPPYDVARDALHQAVGA
jgi:shikimate dehydrogenase